MNEHLYGILSQCGDTYHIAIDGNPEEAILFAMYALDETEHEAGEPQGERYQYRIAILMTEYNETLINNVKAAVKGDGWTVGGVTEHFNGDRQRYQYEFNITKWRARNT